MIVFAPRALLCVGGRRLASLPSRGHPGECGRGHGAAPRSKQIARGRDRGGKRESAK